MDWIHQITGAHSKRPLWQVVLSHPLVTNVTHNPLNLALLALLLYLLIPALWPKSTRAPSIAVAREPQSLDTYNWLPPHHPPSTEWRTYTPKTLALFDGTQQGGKRDRKILLSIDGHVFDVTSGGRFYGPSGPYGNFAGRDASRGMAKQSFDTDVLTPLDKPIDDLADLTEAEVKAMKEWEAHFKSKYPVVGKLVNEGQA